MAAPEIINAKCPHCQNDIEVSYYNNIDVEKDPHLKVSVLDGSLFNYTCPHCAKVVPVVGPLLYHDPSVPTLIYCVPPEMDKSLDQYNEMLSVIRETEKDRASEYQARIVNAPIRLIEKIHMQDRKLDDRLVELVKVAYLRHYGKQLQEKGNIRGIMYMPDTDSADAQIVFTFNDVEDVASCDFSMEYYNHFATTYAESINKKQPEEFIKIDSTWALNFLNSNVLN